jgi:hypothetical protein
MPCLLKVQRLVENEPARTGKARQQAALLVAWHEFELKGL